MILIGGHTARWTGGNRGVVIRRRAIEKKRPTAWNFHSQDYG